MKPYYERGGIQIFHGDCREILPTLADDSADLVLTDPPYGLGKAHWDTEFPDWWFLDAARIAPVLGVMPGPSNILRCPMTVGRLRYRWTFIAHLVNGMTLGRVGYGNYIPCLVYSADGVPLFRQDGDIRRFVVGRDPKPDHPSPKPFEAMRWLVDRLPGTSLVDPFMGSGTTLRAAKDLGKHAIGIEIEEHYCEIAARRLQQEVLNFGTEATA